MFSIGSPYPQVVKDVTDKSDIADPGLEGMGSQLITVLILLLQSVEKAPPEDTLACLFAFHL